MLLRFFTCLILFVLVTTCGYSQARQQPYLDSLLKLTQLSNPDSTLVATLEDVQRFYFNRGVYDSTLKYAWRALPLAKRLHLKKRAAKVNFIIGLCYTNKTQYDSAEVYLQEALRYVPIVQDTLLEVNTYNALSKLYSFQTDYSKAMEYLMLASTRIDQASSQKVKDFLPMTYGNIGNTLIAEGQLQKGNDYLQKALVLRGYPDEQRFRLFIYLDVYGVYMKQNNLPLAKIQLDSAVALSLQINNIVATSIVANNEGYYYQTINDTQNALKAYMKSYLLSDSTGNDYQKSEVGVNISYLYVQQKKYAEAEKFAHEALTLGKKFKNLKVVADAYGVLKNIETKTGNLSRALYYAELHKIYADSATNSETQKLILSLESRYQHQKKESEIATLTNLATQKELEVVKQNRLLIGVGIFSCGALLILGLLYMNSRQRQLLAEHKQSLQREHIKFLEGQQQVATLQGILKGQDEERGRLAKDLHDGLGGLLSGVKFSLTNMKSNVVLDAESAFVFERALDMLDNSISELRRVAHNMMPEVLVKFGLEEALKSYCDSIQQSGIFKVNFQSLGSEIRMTSNNELILYRIVQELLNNAAKYAKASTVLVQLAFHENEISITVEDNGVGFDVNKTQQSTGAGWNNIRSRVEYLGGTVDVSSSSTGTSVYLHIPV
ncbi:MAG: hypothetical protein KF856_09355 [Cyclobacteriaceae bacterium]|nr:hypothetical protein [Cyclobacteriaceae bacterium]